ncbi:hypothetical protein LLG95_07500 [bacterium]|nr:hypothetical protein [bacterium]
MKRVVYLLYCLSGLIALGYQVVWFRALVDRFGSTNLTFALVVVNFIAGLGAGSLASRRLAGFIERKLGLSGPFQTYGVVELLIAAGAALTPLSARIPADLWGSFPYRLAAGIYQPTHVYQVSEIAIATALVFIPCFFMGITFPLLCNAFSDDERFPSALYGWNTVGSCAGILLSQFLFLPYLGHDRAFLVIMALNVMLGLIFIVLGAIVPRPRSETQAPALSTQHSGLTFHPSVLLACAVLSGLISGALEGNMYQRVHFTGLQHSAAMSFVSFWAIVGIFAASFTVRASRGIDLFKIKAAFLWALAIYMITGRFAYSILRFLSSGPAGFHSLPVQLAYIGIFVFPSYYLIALLLPYVCNKMQGNRRHLGLAYGLNTFAFCAGMVVFSSVATRVNIFYSLKLMMATFGLVVAMVLLLKASRPLPRWQPAAGLLAFAGMCLLTPSSFDRSYFRPGSPPAKEENAVRAMMSNGAHTTFILTDEMGDRLFFDSHSMSGTNVLAQVYMRLMAHVPLLAQESPQKALLICFGVGNTASAIATYDSIRRLDIVDLNDKVFLTAPEFARYNNQVYRDPRVRLIHDDGRNYLNLTDQKYDLVTSEPPPPMQAGVYRLYSTEYYQAVRAHLTPTGMMTQWLPIEQMPPKAVDRAVASFVQSFPFAYAYVGASRCQHPSTNIILLGSNQQLDPRRIEQWSRHGRRTLEDLQANCLIDQPLQIFSAFTAGTPTLKRLYGSARAISDQRNDLEYTVFTRETGTMPFNPVAMLDEIGADRLACGRELRRVCTNLALLRSVIPDFPVELLETVKSIGARGVKFADADWRRITKLNEDATQAFTNRDPRRALELLNESLALAGDQFLMLEGKAQILSILGRDAEAAQAYARAQELKPKS